MNSNTVISWIITIAFFTFALGLVVSKEYLDYKWKVDAVANGYAEYTIKDGNTSWQWKENQNNEQ